MNTLKPFSSSMVTLIVLLLTSCTGTQNNCSDDLSPEPVQVMAAAGTHIATDEICDSLELSSGGLKVIRNYSSSGVLARQIEHGASCDIFISANKQWIDYLIEKELLASNSIEVIAGNSLVVIAPKGKNVTIPHFTPDFDIVSAIPDIIAIGDPAYVPVGKYTQSVFDSLGWSSKLQDKTILGKDVSAVRHYVEIGECDWGVVYLTEALQSKKVDIIAHIPEKLQPPICFYMANLHPDQDRTKLVCNAFLNANGQGIFDKYGYKTMKSRN